MTHLPESPLISSSEKWKSLCHWADRGPDEIKCAVQASTGMQVLDPQMVVTVIFRLSWGEERQYRHSQQLQAFAEPLMSPTLTGAQNTGILTRTPDHNMTDSLS